MELTGETRLNKALDAIPGALEYIVALNPHDFQRLRNPLARKYMSTRISLRRIAAMVDADLKQMLTDLAALSDGSVTVGGVAEVEMPQSAAEPPAWMQGVDPEQIHWVDLMLIDEVLGDPIPPISLATKRMAPGSVIALRHQWEPQPLYDIWSKTGLEWFARREGPDEVHMFIHKPAEHPQPAALRDVPVTLFNLPEYEWVPRVAAMFAQLRPGEALELWAALDADLEPLHAAMGAHHPGAFEWSPGEPDGKRQSIRVRRRS